jgi:hypothetical protein
MDRSGREFRVESQNCLLQRVPLTQIINSIINHIPCRYLDSTELAEGRWLLFYPSPLDVRIEPQDLSVNSLNYAPHDSTSTHDSPAFRSHQRCKTEEFCTTDRVFARHARLVHCRNPHCGNHIRSPNQSGRETSPAKTPRFPSFGAILHRRHRAVVQNATQTIEFERWRPHPRRTCPLRRNLSPSQKPVPFAETCPLPSAKDLQRRHRNDHNSSNFVRETSRRTAEYVREKPPQDTSAHREYHDE